jgi:nitrite reductase/ring-hydroxylating ferredoxin subunit
LLVEGQPVAASLEDVPLMLLRQDGAIYALNDRCTHRGGPLHEGTVVDDCIECPWHGSRFHLSDGTVARGPATTSQQSFEVQVEAGRVRVRRMDEQRALRTNPVGSGTPG